MNTPIRWSKIARTAALGAIAAILASGCATGRPNATSTEDLLSKVSEPARTTIRRVTTGGKVEKVGRETERGRIVYDVEADVAGRHEEFTIAESDGAILGTEVQVDLGDLPPPVRAAAESFFDNTTGLTSMKGLEYGVTSYEIVGKRKGRTVEVTFDPSGKRIE